MKARYWAALMAVSFSSLGIAIAKDIFKPAAPAVIASVKDWTPTALQQPSVAPARSILASTLNFSKPRPPTLSLVVPKLSQSLDPAGTSSVVMPWLREIGQGETLDALLVEAGLDGPIRAEVALALGAEYDLRHLRPGNKVSVVFGIDAVVRSVALEVDDGVIVEAVFGNNISTQTIAPELQSVTRAEEVVISSSLFVDLEKANVPARFAVDLSQMLGGTVDFRRDLQGGETLRILWKEDRINGEAVGQPEITFAALELGDALYEVVWPEDGTGRATIFVNGETLRVFAQPVEGARLSSVFGQRRHPVYGNIRMHSGVDFAAAMGTPVYATAPGRISFVGWRGGYGRVVEISHGEGTVTRYTHLSAALKGLTKGQSVLAGQMIGNVGATGTATGPNLHYEVLVDGRPTDPLSDDLIAARSENNAQVDLVESTLEKARYNLQANLTKQQKTRGSNT